MPQLVGEKGGDLRALPFTSLVSLRGEHVRPPALLQEEQPSVSARRGAAPSGAARTAPPAPSPCGRPGPGGGGGEEAASWFRPGPAASRAIARPRPAPRCATGMPGPWAAPPRCSPRCCCSSRRSSRRPHRYGVSGAERGSAVRHAWFCERRCGVRGRRPLDGRVRERRVRSV